MKIGILSSNLYSLPLIAALQRSGADVTVWAAPGEQQELLRWCRQQKINVTAEGEAHALYSWMKGQKPDLVFVIGYNRRIRVEKLAGVPIYNIHFGPLPGYRGPSPVFWQLKNGEEKIGLTIHELTERIDAGGIVWSRNVTNEAHFTYNFVHLLFSELLVEGAYNVIGRLGQRLMAIPQEEKNARTQGRPRLEDVLIDWKAMGAEEICNLVKACNAWNVGALTNFYGNELKIADATPASHQAAGQPGTILSLEKDHLSIACRDGQVIQAHYLRLNQLPFPARWAAQLGFKPGQCLGT